jgi:4-hydroxy-tetrahydrodipicolinate synthase
MAIFKGSGVALVTPFTENNEVDYDGLRKLVDFHVEHGTDAIIVCGTSGESSTRTNEERIEAINVVAKQANGRIPVIAGTGSNDTEAAIYLSQEAEKCGVDGLLLVTPYYNKATQGGLVQHFSAIAKAIDIPVILYNVPSRTGTNILPETAVKLCKEVDNIVGIKDATGNLAQTSKMMQLAEGCIDLYSGEDGLVVPIMSLGGIGVISVLSNVAPRQTHDMCMKALDGDFKGACEIQLKALPLIDALFSEVNPIPVKAALEMIGFKAGPLRLPLTTMTEEKRVVLEQELKKFGLIK